MYIERFITPHPLKQTDTEPRMLSEVIDPDRIALELSVIGADDPERYDTAVADAASFVTSAVRKALWYPVAEGRRDDFEAYDLPHPLTLEATTERQFAGCIGYTIVSSEYLDRSGIENWVTYTNGHATILLPLRNSGVIKLEDPLVPQVNQDLDHALIGGSIAEIDEELADYGRAAAFVNTQRLAERSSIDSKKLFRMCHWLRRDNGGPIPVWAEELMVDDPGFVQPSETIQYKRFLSRYKVIMNIFRSDEGRQVLANYLDFRQEVATDDYVSAANCLFKMSGSYPDIDVRQNSHADVKRIIVELSKNGRSDLAAEIIDDYFSSFSLSNDTRVLEAQGDCLRLLALHGKDTQAAYRALDAYTAALRSPKSFKEALIGKITEARSLYHGLNAHMAAH